jgi:chloramphenicol-sensitive protein RarD
MLEAIRDIRIVMRFSITALLLSGNWLIYIWAVNSNYIVESSLGYYINPLINVLLGFFFLKERPRPLQWMALFFAFSGVCYLTFAYGSFPWIALTLAITFWIYGLLKKTAPLPSLEGLCLETSILFIPALLTLIFLANRGELNFVEQDSSGMLLFAAAGLITSLPLLLFGYAAQKIQLSTLGVIQYLAPTLQLCIGIFVYAEPFPQEQLIGFALVWFGLLIYGSEGIVTQIRQRKTRLAT